MGIATDRRCVLAEGHGADHVYVRWAPEPRPLLLTPAAQAVLEAAERWYEDWSPENCEELGAAIRRYRETL